ncbi:MAG: addiction module antitoxin [Alphaproteobacteria bacterium]
MPKQTTMTVRVSGALSEFVASNIGDNGNYENVSEYVRDLIRRDKERAEAAVYEKLKLELSQAFSQPDNSYVEVTAQDIIFRNGGEG